LQVEKVTLVEVLAAARSQHASLVPESAGHLVLGVARAMGGRPFAVAPQKVLVGVDGEVSVAGARPATPAVAAQRFRMLLRTLLDASQGQAPALRVVCNEDPPDLERLLGGVARALIPMNRGAARRALGRLARETIRAKDGRLLPAHDDAGDHVAALAERPQTTAERAPSVPAAQPPAAAAPVAPPPASLPALEVALELDEPRREPMRIELATPTPPHVVPITAPVEPTPTPAIAEPEPEPVAVAAPEAEDEIDVDLEEEEEAEVEVPDAHTDVIEAPVAMTPPIPMSARVPPGVPVRAKTAEAPRIHETPAWPPSSEMPVALVAPEPVVSRPPSRPWSRPQSRPPPSPWSPPQSKRPLSPWRRRRCSSRSRRRPRRPPRKRSRP
jgi:hypothetical protein